MDTGKHRLLFDTKVIEKISNHEIGRVFNYLKITGLKPGVGFELQDKDMIQGGAERPRPLRLAVNHYRRN